MTVFLVLASDIKKQKHLRGHLFKIVNIYFLESENDGFLKSIFDFLKKI